MSGLYFLGIKKSSIKKMQPFKYFFDRRDQKNYYAALNVLKQNFDISESNSNEGVINFKLNNQLLHAYFRKFPASDLSVFNQVVNIHCYGPIIDVIKGNIANGTSMKILDAGANVGYSCIYFKSFFPDSEMIAIEPAESNFNQLVKNIEINEMSSIELVKGALWYNSSYLEVVRDFRDNREAAFTVRETNSKTDIRGYSFEDLMAKSGWNEIDLLKIDIEGGERFLFDTDAKADAILKKVRYLAIEIHDEFNIRDTIYNHLKRNSFDYIEFDDLTLAYKKTYKGDRS